LVSEREVFAKRANRGDSEHEARQFSCFLPAPVECSVDSTGQAFKVFEAGEFHRSVKFVEFVESEEQGAKSREHEARVKESTPQRRRWRKGFKSFRLGGGGKPVVETGKYEIFRKPLMDHHGGCKMDCVEAL
jgi:hypothetical protein